MVAIEAPADSAPRIGSEYLAEPRHAWPILLIVGVALYLVNLGGYPLYTKGEPREAVTVFDIVHGGGVILPQRAGVEIPSKPLLMHWMAALVSLVAGGVNEFAVRLPSAGLAHRRHDRVLLLSAPPVRQRHRAHRRAHPRDHFSVSASRHRSASRHDAHLLHGGRVLRIHFHRRGSHAPPHAPVRRNRARDFDQGPRRPDPSRPRRADLDRARKTMGRCSAR